MTLTKSKLAAPLWVAVWLIAGYWLLRDIHPLRPGESVGGLGALAGGVLAGRDTLSHDYPAAWWGWSQIRDTFNIPLWNPSWFCGEAFIASQTFMPFYPPSWLSMILPFPLAFNIQYPLHLALAAAVMAWSCRRRGLGWLAAGLAGLSFGFGSHLATLTGPGHIQKLQALAWLPMVTLGAWRIGRGDARQGFLPLGIGLALQVTAGHLQIVYLTCCVALLEALAGFWGTATVARRGRPDYVPVDFRLALGALGFVFALGLSAVFWIPTAEFASLSNRGGGLSWEDATRGSLPPEEKFEFALPRLLGDSMAYGRGAELAGRPFTNFYIGRYGESSTSSPERVVSDYAGAGVLAFALFALAARRRNNRRAAWGYVALAAATLVLSMGRYLPTVGGRPLYAIFLKIIPGLAHFRSPSTMMASLAYGLVMAAALGVDDLMNPPGDDPQARHRAWRRSGALLLTLAILALALLLVDQTSRNRLLAYLNNTPGAPDAATLAPRLLKAEAIRVTLRGLALILGLSGLWALLAALPERLRVRGAAGAVVLAALVAAWGWDLIDNVRPFWNAAASRPYERFLTRYWPTSFWAKEDAPVRYLEVGNELSNRALTLSSFGAPRYLSVGSASGYHPVTYGKYEAMQRKLGFLNPNFLRIFGVRYLLWPLDSKEQPPAGFEVLERNEIEGKMLLRNSSIQYVRPVEQIFPVKDFETALERLAKPGFNAYESTTVLASDMPRAMQAKVVTPKDTHLQPRVFAEGPGETRIKATMQQRGFIAVSEPAVPGWRLRAWEGRTFGQVPVAFDGFTLGLFLVGGANDVLLFYDPVSQRLGLFITLLTLGAAAFWLGRRVGARRLA